jgi:hypothetical protein
VGNYLGGLSVRVERMRKQGLCSGIDEFIRPLKGLHFDERDFSTGGLYSGTNQFLSTNAYRKSLEELTRVLKHYLMSIHLGVHWRSDPGYCMSNQITSNHISLEYQVEALRS